MPGRGEPGGREPASEVSPLEAGERHWRDKVAGFVLAHLPAAPARVLEIGCGDGALALRMAAAGHQVTAVDPVAPEGPIFRRARFEELDDPGPYDAVVACLALHHVGDLARVLDSSVRLLRPDGELLVVEFGWDRIDQATGCWYWRHLPADQDRREEGFLWSCCQQWRGDLERAAEEFERHRGRWARREELHDSAAMLRELHARYAAELLDWGPYLYLDLDATEADEQAGIDRGEIQATSFRFVGRPRWVAGGGDSPPAIDKPAGG
jgi:SAM-dependent methyltransferase